MRYFQRIGLMLLVWMLSLQVGAAAEQDFSSWLQQVEKDALARGVSESTVETALAGLEPVPRVIELDRKQPEFTLTTTEYLDKVVSARRITQGRQLMEEYDELLREIGSRYGVDPSVLVALWGIETHYGKLTGGFPVLPALATLAWEGRRSDLFRRQFLAALEILDEGAIEKEKMIGSWAGAMGQVQFMPTTYRAYAVDFDHDGRRDLWGTVSDALASAANYLRASGWDADLPWGERVVVPDNFDPSLAGLDTRRTLKKWSALGVKGMDGPKGRTGSLLLPEGAGGPAFMVYENFRTLMKWNRSVNFALSVGLLSDALGQGPSPALRDESALVE